MAILVIGGHTRNIGKTSVVCSVIASMPERRWTAVKITQYGHNVCSADGELCDCQTADHSLAVSEERDPCSRSDSSRYLAAGAVRSIWVRTRQGQLSEAMPRIRKEFQSSVNVIIESNSILRFLKPDLFAVVLDPGIADFKRSTLQYLDRADAVLMPGPMPVLPPWDGVSLKLIERKPHYKILPPQFRSPEFIGFIAQNLTRPRGAAAFESGRKED